MANVHVRGVRAVNRFFNVVDGRRNGDGYRDAACSFARGTNTNRYGGRGVNTSCVPVSVPSEAAARRMDFADDAANQKVELTSEPCAADSSVRTRSLAGGGYYACPYYAHLKGYQDRAKSPRGLAVVACFCARPG
jgi:hypothetical protein